MVPIFKNSKNNDRGLLGAEIKNMLNWATNNKIKMNTNKSKIIYFRRKTPHECILQHEFYVIKCCISLKILGITFNEKLDFKEHF